MSNQATLSALQAQVWDGCLPLEIRLSPSDCRTYDDSDPYLISTPRLSYLPLLLPRLHAFFTPFLIDPTVTNNPYDGYFTYESVPLKWHLPIGLLYDIYSSPITASDSSQDMSTTRPFRLTVHFSTPTSSQSSTTPVPPLPLLSEPIIHDAFINAVKEADFLRSGTAKPIMSLSAADSKAMWKSIQDHDLQTHQRIYSSLLPQTFRNIPLRIYIPTQAAHAESNAPDPPQSPDPTSPPPPTSSPQPSTSSPQQPGPTVPHPNTGSIKIVQSPIPPTIPSSSSQPSNVPTRTPGRNVPQTLGTALHTILPTLFPSRRHPVLAKPVLHGAVVPMSAELETLARWASYGDGWLGVVVVMN